MTWWYACMALVGLLVGSFLNVVIHRLPRMLLEPQPEDGSAYNLSVPASHCPHCLTPLRWYQNLPLLSFVWQRARCGHCQAPIAWRYVAVESGNALIWLACALHWPSMAEAMCWGLWGSTLLALAVIDWETTLLPDALTQPLLWLGIFCSLNGWLALPLTESVTGAMAGYLSLWSIARLFESITHKEGMGQGDFKLLAALGAWLGPWLLCPVVLIASIGGVVVGLALQSRHALREGGYLPFGPFLVGAAWVVAGFASALKSWLGVA